MLSRAAEGGMDPRPVLGIERLFGDLSSNERFVSATRSWLESLYEVGAAETLNRAAKELGF